MNTAFINTKDARKHKEFYNLTISSTIGIPLTITHQANRDAITQAGKKFFCITGSPRNNSNQKSLTYCIPLNQIQTL